LKGDFKMKEFLKTNKKKIIKGVIIVGGVAVGAGIIYLIAKGNTTTEKILEIVESPVDAIIDMAEATDGITAVEF